MNRLKTYDATGIAPNGRLFSGDLNALQDAVAALTDLTQHVSVVDLAVGESGLLLSRFGAGEARISGHLRTDGIIRGLGGFIPGAFTTAARNALTLPPYGLEILNTDLNRIEWNAGTAVAPSWQPVGSQPSYAITLPSSPFDGQEAVLVDSVTNPTYQWRFRYNAGSANTDKWEFIGGNPWSNYTTAADTLTFTTPRAGVWKVTSGGVTKVTSGDASVTPYGGIAYGFGNDASNFAVVESARLAAASAIAVARGGASISQRQISLAVLPVRLS